MNSEQKYWSKDNLEISDELETEFRNAVFKAAGMVQKEIQKPSIYLGDIKKTFERTLRDAHSTKQSLRI